MSLSSYIGEQGTLTKVLVTLTALFATIGTPTAAVVYYEGQLSSIRTQHTNDLNEYKEVANERFVLTAQFQGFIRREWKADIRLLEEKIAETNNPDLKRAWEGDLKAELAEYCIEYPEDTRTCKEDL